jgi:hypothetical protein
MVFNSLHHKKKGLSLSRVCILRSEETATSIDRHDSPRGEWKRLSLS